MKNKKGQIFSTDFSVAIITLLFILITSIYLWTYVNEQIQIKEYKQDLNEIAYYVSASLLESSGNPSNWSNFDTDYFNSTNVNSLGLIKTKSKNNKDLFFKDSVNGLEFSDNYVLDEEKIIRLTELNSTKYEDFKEILGIVGPGYEFEVSFFKYTGSSYDLVYKIGVTPEINSPYIIRVDRFVIIDNTKSQVIIKIWKKCLAKEC